MQNGKKISKRTHASPICKCDGCEKPTMARGMCNTHYMKWRRAQPIQLAHTSEDTIRLIMEAMPATRRQIEQATGFHIATLLRHLPSLRRGKLIYVIDHVPPVQGGRGRWQPVYSVGNQRDKPLTKAMRQEYRDRHATERKEKELQIVVRKPKSKWGKSAVSQQNPFSALGL